MHYLCYLFTIHCYRLLKKTTMKPAPTEYVHILIKVESVVITDRNHPMFCCTMQEVEPITAFLQREQVPVQPRSVSQENTISLLFYDLTRCNLLCFELFNLGWFKFTWCGRTDIETCVVTQVEHQFKDGLFLIKVSKDITPCQVSFFKSCSRIDFLSLDIIFHKRISRSPRQFLISIQPHSFRKDRVIDSLETLWRGCSQLLWCGLCLTINGET